MNTTLLLYLFTRLDALNGALIAVFMLSVTAVALAVMYRMIEADDLPDWVPKKTIGAVFIISSLGLLLVPTQKDVAIIVGGTLLAEAAKSQKVSETTEKTYKLLQQKLDESLQGKK